MPSAVVSFRDLEIVFENGTLGRHLDIPTGSPFNFHSVISEGVRFEGQRIDGKLFLPVTGTPPYATVIIVPGSFGVAPSHLAHAETMTGLGIAALVIDPFGARSVTSTVANQTQYSFAASALDVLAAVNVLAAYPGIDTARIGAQGHSRGGSAVINAAMRRFSEPVLGKEIGLAAVYAAYPWCGQQFLDPHTGDTEVRAVIGDRDEWCLPQQVQGQIHAIRLRGGSASIRIFAGAQHGFDRSTPVELVVEASVSPSAPTTYIDDAGAFVHPLTGIADPALGDRDLMVYGIKAGYGRKGARIGSEGDLPEQFRTDMIDFWQRLFLGNGVGTG